MSETRKEEQADDAAQAGLVLADFIPYRVVALGHIISRNLARAYERENLTIPEWRVLAVVSQAEATAARDVARLTPMDKMAVSRAVASLEERGLVARRTNARDGRVFSLSLSAEGKALFRRVARLARAYERRLLSPLSEEEQTSLKALLARLEASESQ
jgi:DNA-binding MarR family transcriptional regulator